MDKHETQGKWEGSSCHDFSRQEISTKFSKIENWGNSVDWYATQKRARAGAQSLRLVYALRDINSINILSMKDRVRWGSIH